MKVRGVRAVGLHKVLVELLSRRCKRYFWKKGKVMYQSQVYLYDLGDRN